MAEEGVISATVEGAERHPFWIVGGVLGLLAVFWLVSRGSTSTTTTPQNFQFSYGPSDAQVQAGTALSISQAQDQTALSIAGLNATNQQALATTSATAQTGIYGQYFNYLTASGANNNSTALAAAQIQANTANYAISTNDTTAAQIAAIQGNTAVQTAQIAGNATNLATTSTAATQQASIAAQLQAALAAQQTQQAALSASVQTTNLNDSASNYQAGLAATSGGSGSGSVAPTNTAGFVANLYQTLLGRKPDASGLTYWTNEINSGTLTTSQASAEIANSPEAINRLSGA
jgi:hypothetical protein